MAQPLVSCTTPTLGREERHPNIYKMFAQQTYANKELVVLDEGSSPSKFFSALKDPRVRYVHSPIVKEDGVTHIGRARNKLAEMARGEVIVALDDDDHYTPRYIEKMVERLLETKAWLVKLSTWRVLSEKDGRLWEWDTTRHHGRVHALLEGRSKGAVDVREDQVDPLIAETALYGYGWSYVYLKKLWERFKFPESGTEDIFWLRKILKDGYKIGLISDLADLAVHTCHEKSRSMYFPQKSLGKLDAKKMFGRMTADDRLQEIPRTGTAIQIEPDTLYKIVGEVSRKHSLRAIVARAESYGVVLKMARDDVSAAEYGLKDPSTGYRYVEIYGTSKEAGRLPWAAPPPISFLDHSQVMKAWRSTAKIGSVSARRLGFGAVDPASLGFTPAGTGWDVTAALITSETGVPIDPSVLQGLATSHCDGQCIIGASEFFVTLIAGPGAGQLWTSLLSTTQDILTAFWGTAQGGSGCCSGASSSNPFGSCDPNDPSWAYPASGYASPPSGGFGAYFEQIALTWWKANANCLGPTGAGFSESAGFYGLMALLAPAVAAWNAAHPNGIPLQETVIVGRSGIDFGNGAPTIDSSGYWPQGMDPLSAALLQMAYLGPLDPTYGIPTQSISDGTPLSVTINSASGGPQWCFPPNVIDTGTGQCVSPCSDGSAPHNGDCANYAKPTLSPDAASTTYTPGMKFTVTWPSGAWPDEYPLVASGGIVLDDLHGSTGTYTGGPASITAYWYENQTDAENSDNEHSASFVLAGPSTSTPASTSTLAKVAMAGLVATPIFAGAALGLASAVTGKSIGTIAGQAWRATSRGFSGTVKRLR